MAPAGVDVRIAVWVEVDEVGVRVDCESQRHEGDLQVRFDIGGEISVKDLVSDAEVVDWIA